MANKRNVKKDCARIEARFKYLDFILEKTMGEVELLADKPEELREMNPLYAHIKIGQVLGEVIPILKHLCKYKLEIQ